MVVSIVFGARRGWAKNHRFRWLGRPSTQSHSDASPKSLARKPLTPQQQRTRDHEDSDQLYPDSLLLKISPERFLDNPFAQPCFRNRICRKTFQSEPCVSPDEPLSRQTADQNRSVANFCQSDGSAPVGLTLTHHLPNPPFQDHR